MYQNYEKLEIKDILIQILAQTKISTKMLKAHLSGIHPQKNNENLLWKIYQSISNLSPGNERIYEEALADL